MPHPHTWSALRARLQHPLIQAPMAGVQDSVLAVAVSQAGALGSLPAALLNAASLDRELHILQRELGPRGLPYNVNFFCHQPPEQDPEREAAWHRALAPYREPWGLGAEPVAPAPQRQPFQAALADVLATHRPPVVSFHFGLPSAALLDRVKGFGSLVMSSATTVDEALWLQAHGADVVIAQGLEAGGHRGHFLRADHDLEGQAPLNRLLPALKAAVSLPIVAAGGLGHAPAVAAALQTGAAAVQVGTAFLLCDEAKTPAVHRQALVRAAASGAAELGPGATALTRLFSGRPARSLFNRLMRELGPMSPLAPAFPLAGGALAVLRARAEAQGLDDFSSRGPRTAGLCRRPQWWGR
ncbi:MAG: nitronate monooxygenase [Betaproteobacteria bacterium]|nr:nitronate monooxygenase [Betaproteobacteria bacterium]